MKNEPNNLKDCDIIEKIKDTTERAILKYILDGGWLQPDYANRISVPRDLMQEVWEMVDREKLKKKLVDRIETELADRIVNHIASEVATDIKQILSVPERREAIRALARQHIQSLKT